MKINILTHNNHFGCGIDSSLSLNLNLLCKAVNAYGPKTEVIEYSELLKVKNNVKSGAPNQSQAYGVIDKPIESLFVGDRSNNELIKEKDKAGFFPAKEQFYNTELKEKVQEVYKEDFVRFSFEY